jgi:DNA polymerase
MDGRERLRAYLEQRRELGESEFVLDGMSIEDALAAIDKLRTSNPARPQPKRAVTPSQAQQAAPTPPVRPAATPKPQSPPPAVPPRTNAPVPEVQSPSPTPSPVVAEKRATFEAQVDETSGDDAMKGAKQGLVVGNSNGTLFEQNPFHSVRSLNSLAKLIEDCTRCPLYKTAKNAVPGDGDPDADFMCVGEAPGANEDETGHPFVGQAGGLLTKILAAIDLTREQVFITNVLKHRPPGNRNPAPDEVEACSPYLTRQIQMVKPKVILALGTFAAQTLLETKTPIGKLRGAVHRYYGIPLIVTYHPAALLRNPAWKRPTWEDVKLARHILDTSKS